MVAWKDRKVVDVPIDEGISTYKNVERKDSLVETALSLDIYIGDEFIIDKNLNKYANRGRHILTSTAKWKP